MARNPISYWRFGELSGNIAYDETGLQNGSYENVTRGIVGPVEVEDGNAAVTILQASPSQRIVIPDNPAHRQIMNISLDYWFRVNLDLDQGSILTQKWGGGSVEDDCFSVYIKNGLSVRAGVSTLNYSQIYIETFTPTVALGVWTHCQFIYTIDGRFRLYFNGVQIGDVTRLACAGQVIGPGVTPIWIGWEPNGFRAAISVDEFAIFNYDILPPNDETWELLPASGTFTAGTLFQVTASPLTGQNLNDYSFSWSSGVYTDGPSGAVHTYTANESGIFVAIVDIKEIGYVTTNHYIKGYNIIANTTNFTGTPLYGVPPLAVQFTDTSTGVRTSWLWDFGDGTSSMVQNPSHTYLVGGLFTVTLTVNGVAPRTRVEYVRVVQTIDTMYFDITNGTSPGLGTELSPYNYAQLYDIDGNLWPPDITLYKRKIRGQSEEEDVFLYIEQDSHMSYLPWNLGLYGPASWYNPQYIDNTWSTFAIQNSNAKTNLEIEINSQVVSNAEIELSAWDDNSPVKRIASHEIKNCYLDAFDWIYIQSYGELFYTLKILGCTFINRDSIWIEFDRSHPTGNAGRAVEINDCCFISEDILDPDYALYMLMYDGTMVFNNCYFSENILMRNRLTVYTLLNADTCLLFNNLTFNNCKFNWNFNGPHPNAITATVAQKDTYDYSLFNIPTETDPVILQRWIDEDYNTGLFGEQRLGAGAFYFKTTVPPIPPTPEITKIINNKPAYKTIDRITRELNLLSKNSIFQEDKYLRDQKHVSPTVLKQVIYTKPDGSTLTVYRK